MAYTQICNNTDQMTVEELIDYVSAEVDLADFDSLMSCTSRLRALANDRDLVVRQLNRQLREAFRWNSVPSAQVVFLGKGKDFFLRAGIWPSTAEVSTGRVYQEQFSYYVGHDHNYDFLTVPYMGSGYVTEIYEYEPERLQGYVGEAVDLQFLERRHFCDNQVMGYRASRDVHIQYPPDDLSITINLLAFSPKIKLRDQYFFDVEKRVLMEYPEAPEGSRRVSLLEIAGHAGNPDTVDLLEQLGQVHPCRRTRLTSLEAMTRLAPQERERIWTLATADPESLVSDAGRRHLLRLETGNQ